MLRDKHRGILSYEILKAHTKYKETEQRMLGEAGSRAGVSEDTVQMKEIWRWMTYKCHSTEPLNMV